MLGYKNPLFILPFDHRSYFAKEMFHKASIEDLTDEEKAKIKEFKKIIYEGFLKAVEKGIPKDSAAVLVDEQFGEEILNRAKEDGYKTILTTEKSGETDFVLQYPDFQTHIKHYSPTFAKALIRYNPEDDDDFKSGQLLHLKRLEDYCQAVGQKMLVEVLIIPTKMQLAQFESKETFDKKLRPELTIRMIEEFQKYGIEPDVWKLEGFDSIEDYKKIVAAARKNGRMGVSIVVLGRGENEEKVEEWVEVGAKVDGVIGFAVGRTIFWKPILDLSKGEKDQDTVSDEIASNFYRVAKMFLDSQAAS